MVTFVDQHSEHIILTLQQTSLFSSWNIYPVTDTSNVIGINISGL